MRDRKLGTWDKGFEVEEAKELILQSIRDNLFFYNHPRIYSENMPIQLIKAKIRSRLMNLAVLLVQLRNGSRVSEACEAMLKWLEENKDKVYVVVRKRKDKETRAMFIPEEVRKLREILKDYPKISVEEFSNRVTSWASIYFEKYLNSHSLRYAKVTNMLDKGYNPILVAKMMKWKNINMLVEYAQEGVAEKILEKEEW